MRVNIRLTAEPLLFTLARAIPTSSHSRLTEPADLDEVEGTPTTHTQLHATSLVLA